MLNLSNHFNKHKKVYFRIAILAIVFFFIPNIALGATTDEKGMQIYKKLVSYGKWVVIIKCLLETIQSVMNGDVQKAKTNFFGYMLGLVIMLSLPAVVGQIEELFQ